MGFCCSQARRVSLAHAFRRDFVRAIVLVVGVIASIGFTVSLFFATAAFPEGSALAETKMGALLSFIGAPLAIAVARMMRVSRPPK